MGCEKMIPGYMGKILKVDLIKRKIESFSLDAKDAKDFIGGSGLGAKFLHEYTDAKINAFDSENALIFMTGPLAATKAFSGDRFEVVTKSPLTNCYAEASCGGQWGGMLKRTGYDGIIITGKSNSPVYLHINNEHVDIVDAGELWGKDTFQTNQILKNNISKDIEIACIGQGGENLVRFAGIHTQDIHSRMAARAGVGAVMGSKKLKAIAVFGDNKPPIFDEEGFQKFWKEYSKKVASTFDAKDMRDNGTVGSLLYCETVGDLPIKNWSMRRFAGAENISGSAVKEILTKKYYCGSCLVGCGRTVNVPDGRFMTNGPVGGMEYETVAMVGSNLLINDIKAVSKINELCNRFGIDTISTGSVLAMAMECHENNLLSTDDLDGIDLKWGDADAVIEILHKIAHREGIGNLLAEGTRRIASEIGSYAAEFAVHVKGLELPAHDPRAKNSLAISYATSNRGACHLSAFGYDFEHLCSSPELGVPEPLDRFETKGKPAYVARMENIMSMCDSLSTCKFMLFCAISLPQLVQELELITGFGLDVGDFLKTGERIFNLKRMYNNKCGISRKDDTLPPRILNLKRGTGADEDQLPPLNIMLEEYYKLRGWNEIGFVSLEKIKELGLERFLK